VVEGKTIPIALAGTFRGGRWWVCEIGMETFPFDAELVGIGRLGNVSLGLWPTFVG
jgi:hypothetical protein